MYRSGSTDSTPYINRLEPGTHDEAIDFAGHDIALGAASGPGTVVLTSSSSLSVVSITAGESAAARVHDITIACDPAHSVTGVSIDADAVIDNVVLEDCDTGVSITGGQPLVQGSEIIAAHTSVSNVGGGGRVEGSFLAAERTVIDLSESTMTVADNTIEAWDFYSAVRVIGGTSWVVERNVLFNTRPAYASGSLVQIRDTNGTIRNNVMDSGEQATAIEVTDGQSSLIVNNTVTAQSVPLRLDGDCSDVVVVNNILDGALGINTNGVPAQPIQTRHNLLFPVPSSGFAATVVGVDGNVAVDPMLEPGTLAPLAGSPAVDAGEDASPYGVEVDLVGTPRPVHGAYDIGAYEAP